MTRNPYALDRGDLRRRLACGEVTYGTFLGAASPVTAEVCAAAGVDWVLFDLEHGAGGEEQARAAGLLVPDGAAAARTAAAGWQFLAIGSDTTLLAGAVVAELRRAGGTP